MPSYWIDRLDKLPPNVCRLLAREPHCPKQALSTNQIAYRSGLSVQTIRRISKLKSWENVTIGRMQKFKEGCGIIPGTGTGEAHQIAYLKRSFSVATTPLFHIQKLLRMRKDKRMERFFSQLMLPKP